MTAPDPVLCSYCRTPLTAEEIDSRPGLIPKCAVCIAAAAQGGGGSPAVPVAYLMMVVGVGLAVAGVYFAFHEPTYSEKLVGGDAFNYQIYAARGLVLTVSGVLCMLIGLTVATLSNYRRP